MVILLIEHPVPNYDRWKKVFESDPLGRKVSGVQSHRISRPAGDEGIVMIELEFRELAEAESMLNRLRELWKSVEGRIIMEPKARIIEVLENKKY